VPGTSRKNVKRPTSPQAAKRKPREPGKPSKRKQGTRSAKRAKKGDSPADVLQALLLTGLIIITVVLVSIGVLGIKQERAQQPDLASAPPVAVPASAIFDTTTPEAPPVADKPPAVPAPKPPQEKQPPSASAPKTTVKPPAKEPQNRQPAKTPAVKPPAAPAAKPAAIPEPPPKPKHQGTLVFIIDDAGNNLQELEPFLRFPGPLTIAVLPGLPHSAEAARRIRAAGKEVFLHQPMEAVGGQAPGPGAIYAGMTAAEIVALLRQNAAEIGPIAGMNNHQGSKITADQQAMETVLAFCRDQGIYFLDSRTTAETAVPAAARNLGVKIGERNIFIDNEQTRSSMNRYIESGLTLASQKGNAVMIGHTWSPELAPLLADLYQTLTAQGYTFATASSLIK
jgi:polysaccharide deacetylase 2 family uncharacterized protein YibQ